jgi:hypothetical protein
MNGCWRSSEKWFGSEESPKAAIGLNSSVQAFLEAGPRALVLGAAT